MSGEDSNEFEDQTVADGIEEQNGDEQIQEEVADEVQAGNEESSTGQDASNTAINNGTSSTTADAPLGTKIGARGDDDERKIFVGGLHWETTASDLKEYFSKFGTVVDCNLKTDQATGKSRGFGFVLFEDAAIVEKVIGDKSHTLRGRQIDAKRAQARPSASKTEPIKKVFVGGLSPDLPESEIREYFGQYGKVEEVELPFDKLKNQRRAFCFITFETEEMADKAVVNAKQKLGDKEVDVRKATPKSEQDGFAGRGGRGGVMQRGGGRGGYAPTGYPGYGPPAYDYSGYYGAPGYGYGYPGYGPAGYDYSGYYSPSGDWSQYGGGYAAAYPGQQASGAVGGAGPSTQGYKAKRGGATSGGSTGYHPYAR